MKASVLVGKASYGSSNRKINPLYVDIETYVVKKEEKIKFSLSIHGAKNKILEENISFGKLENYKLADNCVDFFEKLKDFAKQYNRKSIKSIKETDFISKVFLFSVDKFGGYSENIDKKEVERLFGKKKVKRFQLKWNPKPMSEVLQKTLKKDVYEENGFYKKEKSFDILGSENPVEKVLGVSKEKQLERRIQITDNKLAENIEQRRHMQEVQNRGFVHRFLSFIGVF